MVVRKDNMGISKNKNRELTDNVSQSYKTFLDSLNELDRQVLQDFLKEVNSFGYNALKLSDIAFIDRNDIILVPVIEKYILLFEDKRIKNELFSYLGFKGNTISYKFLLDEFKKPNDDWDRNNPISWNFTRRCALSNSIVKTANKSNISEVIDLVNNPNTHNDTKFIIEYLGKSKDEKVYELLLTLLNDNNSSIISGTLFALSYFKNHADTIIPLIKPFTLSNNKAHKQIASNTIKKLLRCS